MQCLIIINSNFENKEERFLRNNKRLINKAEIGIIGAGVAGIFSGYYLAKRGYKVIIFDRDYICQRASGVNAGSLALQNKHPHKLILLARKSIDIWGDFGKVDKNIEYTRCGGFRVAETENEAKILKAEQRKQKEFGLNVEYLENKELLKEAPYLSPYLHAANYCELDGFANARIAGIRIAKLAMQEGVLFSLHNQVNHIKTKSNSIRLETNQGIYEADKLILASGAWTDRFLNNLGVKIPIDIDIHQMIVSAAEKHEIKHIITNVDDSLTVKQLNIGTVVIGGAWKGKGNLAIDERKLLISSIKGNSNIACRVIPGISKFLVNRIWSGFNAYSKDRLPLFGKLPGYENIYINCCCASEFTVSPYLGKLIAELIDEGKTSEDIRYLSPNRFVKQKIKTNKIDSFQGI